MRNLHAMLALAAVVAFSAAMASSAVASPEWLDNGAAITAAVKVDSEGTLTLTDMGTGVTVDCEGTGEGTVGPGKADTTTKVSATKCVTLTGSCASPFAEAVGLPWSTTLELVGTAWRDKITTTTAGYKITCSGFLHDTCTGATSTSVGMLGEDPVDTIFEGENGKSAAGNCTVGGAGSGLVDGLVSVLASEAGHLITVS